MENERLSSLGMRLATISKIGISLAWATFAVAILRFFVKIPDRESYEDVLGDAGSLLMAAFAIAIVATLGAWLVRWKFPQDLHGVWIAVGLLFVLPCGVFLLVVYGLALLLG